MPNIPEYSDPLIGKVYGNILDTFDSPTYNIRLFMLEQSLSQQEKNQSEPNETLSADPNKTVILAQTGVTATQIDNVKIESFITKPKGDPASVSISFDIFQPGAATFIDQIQLAKGYLGYEQTSASTVFFLEIRFQGLEESDLDPDFNLEYGGATKRIAGPYRYKVAVNNLTMSLDETGSRYHFDTVVLSSYAYRESIFKIPFTLNTVGKTITEHVNDLTEKLNKWHSEVGNEIPDTISFDLSRLIGVGAGGTTSVLLIGDENLISGADGSAEDTNAPTFETEGTSDAIERQEEVENAGRDTGNKTEKTFEGDKISVKEGTSIEDYFMTILSMNQEYLNKISRKQDLDDAESEIDQERAFVTWMKLNADVKEINYDKSRNEYAKEYSYIPTLYQTSRTDIATDIKETENTDDQLTSKIKQLVGNGALFKGYNYIFTGLNDQIVSLNVEYNQGIGLILPPKGGAIGDASVAFANNLNATAEKDKDISLSGLTKDLLNKDLAKTFKNKIGSFINDLSNLPQESIDQVASQLADATGKLPAEVASIIQSGTSADQRALVDALDSRTISALAANAQINDATAPSTEDDTVTDNPVTGAEYTPTFSDFVYAADILTPGETYINVDQLMEKGYVTVGDVVQVGKITQEASRATDLPTKTDGATYKTNSVQNKLFGFLEAQHADNSFMMECNMSVRGDPWYLGNPTTDKSNNEAVSYEASDNHFLLRIFGPRTYDPDWGDEDSLLNSGYWNFNGLSQTFSGVYRLIGVTNEFSNGVFTSHLRANRIFHMVNATESSDDSETSTAEANDPNRDTGE